jgi:hypothetical protein
VKNTLILAAGAAALAIGGVAVTAGTASAAVVCNTAGDCWHVDRHRDYPGVRLEVHPDDWYFHQRWDNDPRRHWREYHEGRGYYDHGVWVPR